MEELCQADNIVKCAHWHWKLQDPMATKGMPLHVIALAATMVSPPVSVNQHSIKAHHLYILL
jgi:hypothetical protein